MHKRINVIALLLMSAALLIAFLIVPKKEYSEKENRYLQSWPAFTADKLLSGDFMNEIDTYFTDHYFLRDQWISVYSAFNQYSFKDEVNGVYFSKDNNLIEKYEAIERPDLIYRSINAFVENNPDCEVSLMLVPTAVSVNENLLPFLAVNGNQKEDLKIITDNVECRVIDVFSALQACEQSFYRTDHHWTSEAAYRAYTKYCQSIGLKAHVEADYTIETVSEEFYGTIASKTNCFNQQSDCIIKYSLSQENYTVSFGDTVADSLYFDKCLKTTDKYAYFLDGNHPLVTITNNNITSGEKLLIVKDSYANCFVPFLIDHYQEIVLIDPRYYGLSIHDYIQENDIHKVLFLYNMNTIGEDTGIRGIE